MYSVLHTQTHEFIKLSLELQQPDWLLAMAVVLAPEIYCIKIL